MVNVGDSVVVTFNARSSFTDFQPLQTPATALRARLEQAGLKVLSVDDSALGLWTSIETTFSLGYAGYGQIIVSVQPYSSAFGAVQDVAGLVAGAAQAIGLTVDFQSVSGRIVGYANPTQGQPSSAGYQQNQTGDDTSKHRSFLDDIADALGISKGTLETIAVLGLVAVIALPLMSRR